MFAADPFDRVCHHRAFILFNCGVWILQSSSGSDQLKVLDSSVTLSCVPFGTVSCDRVCAGTGTAVLLQFYLHT